MTNNYKVVLLTLLTVILIGCKEKTSEKPFVIISESEIYKDNPKQIPPIFYADNNIIFLSKDTVYYYSSRPYRNWCGNDSEWDQAPFIGLNQTDLIRIGLDTLESFFNRNLVDSLPMERDSLLKRHSTILLKSDKDSIYNVAYPIVKNIILKKRLKWWYDALISEEEYQVIQANRLKLNYDSLSIDWGKTKYIKPKKTIFKPPTTE